MEQVAQAHINRRRIRHEEHEDNHRGDDLERRAVVTGAEKFRHGQRIEPRCHFARAPGKDKPGEEGADERVAEDNPHRLDAEAPAEPSGVADEEHGGEIGSAVGECAHPRPERAAAQEEIADVLGALHAPVTNGKHDEDVKNDERDVNDGAHRVRGITPDLTATKQADWRSNQRVFDNQNLWMRKAKVEERMCLGATGGVLPKLFWRRRSAAVSAAARSIIQKPVEFRALIRQSGCCGWDTRAPFYLGNTPSTLFSTGDWKVRRNRGPECPRNVAQAFQSAGAGDFPVALTQTQVLYSKAC